MNKGLEAFIIPTMNGLEKVVRYADIEKELKALEIIRNYGYFDCQGDLIVRLPTNRKEEYDLLKETLR